MHYIDFHTHAFPDPVAARAIPALAQKGGVTPHHDGTIAGLLAAMDRTGIHRSVLLSIATQPAQSTPILQWSREIRSERIIPFPSCHPDDPAVLETIDQIAAEDFKGIKMHPYYQDFFLDDPRMQPIYERINGNNLILLLHTGFDIGFPRDPRANPDRIAGVAENFPELRLVASHLGAWQDWEEVEKHLMGKPIYMDIAFALEFLSPEQARSILTTHPADHLLFGTDSPWADQQTAIEQLQSLQLPSQLETAILSDNAGQLLGFNP